MVVEVSVHGIPVKVLVFFGVLKVNEVGTECE